MHFPSAQERAAHTLQRVIKVRGGNAIYVRGALPNKATPDAGLGPNFILSADLAGQQPLCSVSRRMAGANPDADLTVTGPDGAELGVLRLPTRGVGGRPRYEMQLPDAPP
ncbi:hypothetical protein [Streptomyces sp. NPDC059639]|uniref:hypothetical protein n=1 Tax=Streptomyces sp. NPDC059639 TaxID=3346891 RepID=UPI00367F6FD2